MTTTPPHYSDPAALEARFGLRVAALLSEQARQTPPGVSERLRFAREQALASAAAARRQEQRVVASLPVVVGRGRIATLAFHGSWWLKLASAMPLAMLVFGLVAIDRVHDEAQISAAAEVDAALLSDDLPPAAYTDPGFAEYLKTTQQQ